MFYQYLFQTYFKESEKPKTYSFAMCARDKREILKIVKIFFQKYPHYQFITFRDMSGLPREDLQKNYQNHF